MFNEKRWSYWYHVSIITLYIILIPLVFILFRENLSYQFSKDNFFIILSIILIFILGFLLIFRKNITLNKNNLKLKAIAGFLLYAFIIGFAEEALFRGLVQGFFQMYFNSLIFAIILAASIYGCAHLLNGAKGLGIKKLNWKFAKLTFLLGLPFGIIFAITNSLLIPSLLHAFLVFFMCLTRE